MRSLLIGVSLLALAAPAARAQQADDPVATVSGQAEPSSFVVYFGFNKATLDASARQVIAMAADEYKRTGGAQINVTGYADKAGQAEHNQRLSERRAEAVRRELERDGVESSAIQVAAEGENDPAVPTADGVPEARNRRVVIAMPQPEPTPAPPPAVAAAPPPVMAEPAAAPPPERPKRFVFSLGPLYGHNFREKDHRGGGTQDDFAGAELTLNALPGFLGGVSLKQGVLWAFNAADDDGLAGRSVLSLDFAPDLGFVRPRLSANVGGVYGKGVQAGFVAGPELALDLNLLPGFTLRPKVAYDFQLRNPSWDEGILWAGLDLGIRF
jgi:opacity protein-like surface antigen